MAKEKLIRGQAKTKLVQINQNRTKLQISAAYKATNLEQLQNFKSK